MTALFLGGVEVPCSNKSGGGDEVPSSISMSKLLHRKICISQLKYLVTLIVVSTSSFVLVSLSDVETSAGNQPLVVFFLGFLFIQAFVRQLNTSIGLNRSK
jgi:positive regulator of sigma E activity